MSSLWGMINGIQVANHYPMLGVDSPPNLSLVQAVIRMVANFEFNTDDLIKVDLWGFTDTEKVDIYNEAAGYESYVIMFNLGLELYFFFGFLTLILLFTALKYLHFGC
jgi:hypothetical protein